jgi:hypothetical protein
MHVDGNVGVFTPTYMLSRLSVRHLTPYYLTVIPAKAGIYRQYGAWIPAFAGMTVRR